LEEVREAETANADYIFFGPVFETPSKQAFGMPQGTERLAEVCRTVQLPIIAIGGVDQENAARCIRAGAAGIAAIRIFQQSRDVKALTESVASMHNPRREEP
jgi:thiamine-phosphate pyrophosphorylase